MTMRIGALTGGIPERMLAFFAPVLQRTLDHIASAVRAHEYLIGTELTLADIQMAYLLDGPLRSSLWFWGGASGAAIILAGLLALAFARRLERPLAFTADAARKLGRGELVSEFASGVREANVVVEAMGTASRELAARDQRQQLLLSELSHRVKNVLAVVLALVSRTLADGQTPPGRPYPLGPSNTENPDSDRRSMLSARTSRCRSCGNSRWRSRSASSYCWQLSSLLLV
jgi:signal transduction histidine kinase